VNTDLAHEGLVSGDTGGTSEGYHQVPIDKLSSSAKSTSSVGNAVEVQSLNKEITMMEAPLSPSALFVVGSKRAANPKSNLS